MNDVFFCRTIFIDTRGVQAASIQSQSERDPRVATRAINLNKGGARGAVGRSNTKGNLCVML